MRPFLGERMCGVEAEQNHEELGGDDRLGVPEPAASNQDKETGETHRKPRL